MCGLGDIPAVFVRTSIDMLRTIPAIAIICAPVTAAFGQQQEGFPPDSPESWRVAGTAKVFCSALFVSGRDSAEAHSHLAGYFLGAQLDSISDIHVDRRRRLVRITLAHRVTREAKQYGDQGCVIHQPGEDSVHFTPVRVVSALPDASTQPWPMGDVLPTTPLPSYIDTVTLRRATDAAFANPQGLTAAFIVVHDGRIVAERYANGAHRDMQLESWSMGKSVTGTLIGRLVQLGAFRLEDPAPIPHWHKTPNDPRSKIRIIDLMRMSSGLRFSRGSPEDLPGYHDHDLIYTGALDAFEFVATRPPQFAPNTRGRYRNTDPLLLGMILRDAVRQRGAEYLTWPQRELFDRIGIRRQVLETDPHGNFLLSGYDYGTARNWARLGMLYVNDGVWNGKRLLPEGWTRFVSTPAPAWTDSAYGGMVWVNAAGAWPMLPRDAFAFRGAGGQETYVIPSRKMVVVRMGHFPGARAGAADLRRALSLLMEAIPAMSSTAQSRDAIHSSLVTVDIATRRIDTVLSLDRHIEAPNWSPDGRYFVVNSGGRLYRIPTTGDKRLDEIPTAFATKLNNDHGFTKDGKFLMLSHHAAEHVEDPRQDWLASSVYVMPVDGSAAPRKVTSKAPSFWHGVSPDGGTLAYVGRRDGEWDIYAIPTTGGDERRLTTCRGLDDGPDYTPDGAFIYYNSFCSGTMQIWRMRSDGSEPAQLTQDEYSNWFPHPSPDGRWVVYIAYLEDQGDAHPFGKQVKLRLMDRRNHTVVDLTAPFFGGQGTINVPSWSPDSRRVAFVTYAIR